MDNSLLGFSVHGIFQARVLEWVAISFSRGSSRLGDQTQVSSIVGRRFYCLSHQGSHSAVRVISPAYLRLFMFLPEILIPACDSSSLAFHMMYSVYRTFLVATYFPHNLVSTALWIIFKHKFHSVLPLLNSPLAFFMTMLWALFTKGSEKFRMCSRSYRL